MVLNLEPVSYQIVLISNYEYQEFKSIHIFKECQRKETQANDEAHLL